MARQLLYLKVLFMVVSTALARETSMQDFTKQTNLRKLPDNDYDFDLDEIDMAEVGITLAAILVVLLMICCCCCRRFSLWDCVALACLWEICCDNPNNGGAGDFVMF
mmetsp:Transcript_13744/g.17937  ORF Transcript_13744/g.17937 Transcript_13744/m.17937 type:complete len:107 (-) Transcript_13744:302-622(-)